MPINTPTVCDGCGAEAEGTVGWDVTVDSPDRSRMTCPLCLAMYLKLLEKFWAQRATVAAARASGKEAEEIPLDDENKLYTQEQFMAELILEVNVWGSEDPRLIDQSPRTWTKWMANLGQFLSL